MSEYLNGTCAVCGKKYHICDKCSGVSSYTPWRKICDTSDCYKIYLTVWGYTVGGVDADTTRQELQKCNLSELSTFKPEIQTVIKNLLNSRNKPKKIVKVDET